MASDRNQAVESERPSWPTAPYRDIQVRIGQALRLQYELPQELMTGGELAFLARISRPTASEHLAKLVAARLIAVTKKRRYCYHNFAFGRTDAGKHEGCCRH
jgi:DNA-binding transcriptional ArsR family regulator